MTRINRQENIKLAKVKRAYGIKGELLILPFTPKAKWIYTLSEVTLIKEVKKPCLAGPHETSLSIMDNQRQFDIRFTFTIENCRSYKDGYVLKLQNCNDRTKAEKWHGAFVSVPRSAFTSKTGENIYLIELENFVVVNAGEFVGPIVSFSSNGYHDLIQVKKKDYIYDIPFVKDFLISIDWRRKQIYMNLPGGLLDEMLMNPMKRNHLLKSKTLKNTKKARIFAI